MRDRTDTIHIEWQIGPMPPNVAADVKAALQGRLNTTATTPDDARKAFTAFAELIATVWAEIEHEAGKVGVAD